MSKTDNETNTLKNILLFPEKLSNIILTLIMLLCIGVGVVIASFGLPKRSYKYYPDAEEALYADKFNFFVKFYSNFQYDDKELRKTESMVLYFKPLNSTLYQPQITATNVSIISNSNKLMYYTPNTEIKDYISKLTQRTIYPNTTIEDGIKDAIFKIGYNLKDFTGDVPVVTEHVLKLKETILTLDKKELSIGECDGFKDLSDIFTSFYVKVVDTTDSEGNPKRNIKSNVTLSNEVINKYHLDIQVFGVKGDDVYTLMGYYNLSNVAAPTTDMSLTFPYNYDLDYIYAKAKFINDKGETINVIYKQPFSSLKQ